MFGRLQNEMFLFMIKIGPCSALIYIGEEQPETNSDEFNVIIDKFKAENKAIYVNFPSISSINFFFVCFQVDGRVEVDEIYEDLKNDILKRI